MSDLQLSFNGGPNSLTSSQALTTADNTTWTLGNLAGTTAASGNYVLLLSGAGIQDGFGNVLAASVSTDFTVNTVAPTAAITPVSPNPRNTAVDTMTITFSEPVSGFALSNLQLTLSGGANLLTSAQTLTTADNTTWTLGNLAGLTAASGSYTLTLSPTGIVDAAGNAQLAGALSTFALHAWQNTSNPLDVNDDGKITPIDALLVINYLNQHGSGPLPSTYTGPYYLDVNGDNAVTPLDALAVINYLNANLAPAVVGSTVVSDAAASAAVGGGAAEGSGRFSDEIAAAGISFSASSTSIASGPNGSLLARSGGGVAIVQPQIAAAVGPASVLTSATGTLPANRSHLDAYFAGSSRGGTDPTLQADAVDAAVADPLDWAA